MTPRRSSRRGGGAASSHRVLDARAELVERRPGEESPRRSARSDRGRERSRPGRRDRDLVDRPRGRRRRSRNGVSRPLSGARKIWPDAMRPRADGASYRRRGRPPPDAACRAGRSAPRRRGPSSPPRCLRVDLVRRSTREMPGARRSSVPLSAPTYQSAVPKSVVRVQSHRRERPSPPSGRSVA